MANAQWIADRFKEAFWEAMSEVVSDSDIPFFNLLTDSAAFIIRSDDNQEKFYLSDANIEDFFAVHLPDLVSFKQQRLFEWAKEVNEFYKENLNHPEVEEIFANRLHYDVVIKSMLKFQYATEPFREFLVDVSKVKGVLLADEYPKSFQKVIVSLAHEAIRPALMIVAYELETERASRPPRNSSDMFEIKRVKKEPSFRDIRGAIPFIIADEHLAIGGTKLADRAIEYREVLDRSLGHLKDKSRLQGLHNRDPDVVDLIGEYELALNRKDGISVPMLWTIGQDIERRIQLHQSSSDPEDALNDKELFYVNSFMSAHNLYLQCFDIADKVAEDVERSARLYEKLDTTTRNNPWSVLEALGGADSIVEARTGTVMRTSSSVLVAGNETKGMIAIGLGLLRGAFHAMGGALINAANLVLSKAAVEVGKVALILALKDVGVYNHIISFFQVHMTVIIQLSTQLPTYFGWLKRLLDVFHLG